MGFDFPQDPNEQLKLATEAVFKSWFGKRAIDYRNAAGIAHDLGTGVNIQTMVFGNMDNSGTGVAFTRNPSNGDPKVWGEYLMNAQGEDVVAGIRNAKDVNDMVKELPQAYNEFIEVCEKLEKHYREMQDVEFTVERGKLWMLQTRDGKRTAKAAVTIAVDFAKEGLISKEEAVKRIKPSQVDTLLHPQFIIEEKRAAEAAGKMFATGVNASPGAAVGRVYFDADTAEAKAKEEGRHDELYNQYLSILREQFSVFTMAKNFTDQYTVHEIIDPRETRPRIIEALRASREKREEIPEKRRSVKPA